MKYISVTPNAPQCITFFISCENVDGIMGLESIYLLRLFEMLHFSFEISDIEFDENLRAIVLRKEDSNTISLNRNFLIDLRRATRNKKNAFRSISTVFFNRYHFERVYSIHMLINIQRNI